MDTEGNQLPYVDAHEMEYVTNVEMYNAKIVTGAFDWAALSTTILNYSAYESGAKAGNYEVRLWNSGKGGEVYYNLNMTDKDPVLRKIHQDVRYRRALSLAINRDEMNQLLFFGKAIPRQMTVLRSSKYFKPEYETVLGPVRRGQGQRAARRDGAEVGRRRRSSACAPTASRSSTTSRTTRVKGQRHRSTSS